MRRRIGQIATTTVALYFIFSTLAIGEVSQNKADRAKIISSDATAINLEFNSNEINFATVEFEGENLNSILVPGEGMTYAYGKPILPMVSRFVVVPPNVGLELQYEVISQRRVHTDSEPDLRLEQELLNGPENLPIGVDHIYPAVCAEISEPMVIRGVRVVKLSTYPVQYDPETQEYVYNEKIRTKIVFNDNEPVNPALYPVRRHRSKNFLKYMRMLAINGDMVGRDDPDRDQDPPYVGHYLIVQNENLSDWVEPFIEWRRKSGYKVDILSLTNNQASNNNTVKREIQELYDAYLEEGIDPFEYILLIGDRSEYFYAPGVGSRLDAPNGQSIWANWAEHGDYLYGCLEGDGDDHYPDVAICRWPSGNRNMVELAVGRTLAYEAEPDMEDPSWFTRGGVYSQHWGNGENSAWHVTIHTNVRWGQEVLEHLGFDDVELYEEYNWDRVGHQVGPFIRDRMNDQTNVLIGRAENYYFVPGRGGRSFNNEIEENTVFAIDICASGHGEWAKEIMFRTGSGNNLKGYVACSNGWGGPPTVPMSAVWMEMTSAILQHDLPYGWGYSMAITAFERYIPDFRWRNIPVYRHIKTDFNAFGDPGIQPWIGVPRIVEAEFPEVITAESRYVKVHVTDTENDESVAGAQVTFYIPGNDNNRIMVTTTSNQDGIAEFIFGENDELPGDEAFITVTGRDIRPFFGNVDIRNNISSADLASYILTETEGNDNGDVNPGETFTLELTASNLGNRDDLEGLTAIVVSQSPWVEIEENEVSFGDVAAGEEADGDEAVVLNIHPSCPDGVSRPYTKPVISIEFHSGDEVFYSAIKLEPKAPNFILKRVIGGDQIPAERRELDFEIENIGSTNAPVMTAILETAGIGVSVVNSEARFPAIAAGRTGRVNGNRFLVSGNRIAVPGDRHELMMILQSDANFIDTIYFDLQVGEEREGAPQGPDNYGYICFDDTDRDWDIAPEYDWFEISPEDRNAEVDGETCNFRGNSPFDVGESEVVDMGMTTQFYGELFDQITISTNGFIALGDQGNITNFQNWPMDRGIGGGAGMIAPFWDWLDYNNNSEVCYYYDEEESRFIIEWYRMRHHQGGNQDLTFQVILYDNEVWVTETGDSNILIQYRSISNVRGQQDGGVNENNIAYASVGISSPDGMSGISYSFRNQYPETSARLENERAILFATSTRFKSGSLYGVVMDEETGQPIQDAVVYTEHGFTAITDEEGNWEIADALADIEFNITASKQGYNEQIIENQMVEEDDTLEINFSLLHPEFELSREEIWTELSPDENVNVDFTLRNDGNGPLDWYADQRLVGDANAAPWEHRVDNQFGELVEDTKLYGVVFIDDHFYVSGANGEDPVIYIINRDGELIDEIQQPEDDRYGMKGITYDGELIWGAVRNTIYGITPDGEVITSFESPYNPTSVITWDPDHEVLWVGGTVTNPVGMDREGNRIDGLTIDRQDLRIYGLSYYPDDPDNAPLYIFSKERETNRQTLHKYSFEDNDTTFVTYLFPEAGGSPQGTFITNAYDVYSWVLLSVVSLSNNAGGDRVNVWQIDARRDWFDLDHNEGTLEPDNVEEFTLTFDSNGLPPVPFEAEIVFYHNATGGNFTLPITLDVLGGVRNQILNFIPGWNLISSNAIPENLDIEVIFSPLVEEGVLQIVKNGFGQFYNPEFEFNDIEEWVITEGYQVSVTEEAQITISGGIIPFDEPIDLIEGWNLAAYFPNVPLEVPVALSSIEDELIIAKDGWGNFYLPAFDFNNMGEMENGRGYQFKLSEVAQLVYNINDDGVALAIVKPTPEHYSIASRIGDNMSVLLLGTNDQSGIEIGAFDGKGTLIGAGIFDAQGQCGFAIWGDEQLTSEIDGATSESDITLKLWDGNQESDVNIELLIGELSYQTDSHVVGKMLDFNSTPLGFGIHQTYPNPTNGPAKLMYAIESDGLTTLKVFDLSGRLVDTLVNGDRKAGTYQLSWDTAMVPSGLYLMRLSAGDRTGIVKIAVLK